MRRIPRTRINRQKVKAAISNMRGGPKRMTQHLADYGPTPTGELSATCAIANLSAAAFIANEYLRPHGLVIVAKLPEKLLVNRFGQKSMSHIWKIVALRG